VYLCVHMCSGVRMGAPDLAPAGPEGQGLTL
jgi:hypothetical protein